MTVHEVDTVALFGRRQWRRRLRAWRPWLIAVGVVVALAFAGWVVYVSPWLGVHDVEVEGAHEISSQEVTAAAQVAPGTPLARVDLAAVQARVEAIPAVASAVVQRSWPHTIDVTVTERQPIAVTHHDGSWWVLDKTGVLFSKSVAPGPDQPIVELDGTPGPETLPQVASVLGSLPPSLLADTNRITASSVDSITLSLKNGSQVRWGSATDSLQKAAVLDALLHHKAQLYDVSIPSQPATKG